VPTLGSILEHVSAADSLLSQAIVVDAAPAAQLKVSNAGQKRTRMTNHSVRTSRIGHADEPSTDGLRQQLVETGRPLPVTVPQRSERVANRLRAIGRRGFILALVRGSAE
jgi:hypothetical protein